MEVPEDYFTYLYMCISTVADLVYRFELSSHSQQNKLDLPVVAAFTVGQGGCGQWEDNAVI